MNHHVTMSPELLIAIDGYEKFAKAIDEAQAAVVNNDQSCSNHELFKALRVAREEAHEYAYMVAKIDLLITAEELVRAYEYKRAEFRK